VQSEIRIGQIVPVSRKDQDYPAVRLLSQAFGESFGARLNRVLRIEMGLTYGARGAFNVETDAAALGAVLLLALMVWSVVVAGHILRHTFGISLAQGVAIAVAFQILAIGLLGGLLGA
jgi:hypothetical protein